MKKKPATTSGDPEFRHPYRTPHLDFWLDGKVTEGGNVTLILDDKYAEFRVGCSEFAVLAVLIQEAKSSAPAWMPRGFLTTPQLQQELNKIKTAVINTRRLARFIHNIRNLLKKHAERKFGVQDGRQWAFEVLETADRGYRLSIPPKQLRLILRK